LIPLPALPLTAAWQHLGSRIGFEVAYISADDGGHRLQGATTAVDDGEAWIVAYDIYCDDTWRTRSAHITGTTAAGVRSLSLEADGRGAWRVNGAVAPQLVGCLDVDLESSALTNTLPVHRLQLAIGEAQAVPAAYVRAVGLTVRRLEQTYRRETTDAGRQRYSYTAPEFDFAADLVYDQAGLVLDYPGIARRVG
jgi:uncharacterized protein